jgi:hypothetical protein
MELLLIVVAKLDMLVEKHEEKKYKYTENTSLEYETVNVSYALSPTTSLKIPNLVQAVYP